MTPEQEDAVRRTLADAAGPEPTPPEVAARLETVLAGLVEQRARADATRVPGTALAAPRQPTRIRLLAAAAVVAVVALGSAGVVAALHNQNGTGTTAAGSAASRATPSATVKSPHRVAAPNAAAAGTPGQQFATASGHRAASGLTALHRDTLSLDVRRLVQEEKNATDERLEDRPNPSCATPPHGAGDRLYAVRLDGAAGTLVVGPRRDGLRRASVYACQRAGAPEATTTVR